VTRIDRFLPAVRWIRRYERGFLWRDLAGGLAVGSMLIPQGLAFAQIVQVLPVAGLWSGVAAMVAYALFGPSRHLMVGPEAGTAMMVAAVLTSAGIESPEERLGAAALVALLVGAVLVLAGLFRLGAIADFLSRPILVGYMNGVALVLVASQLPGVLGIETDESDFLPQVVEIGSNLGGVHSPTLAAANVAAGLAHGVPAAGSDARTVINDASGSRTQVAGLFASAFVVAILLLAPLMALLPTALLGAVVIASALALFDLRGLVRIWRVRAPEGVLAVTALVGVLVLGILTGVLVAVALAVADLVRRAARPHDAVLGRLEGSLAYGDIEERPGSETLPGLVIYRVDAPLFFANARFVREQIGELVDTAETQVRMLVLDCGAMFDLDVTAAEMLEELDREFDARGITLALAEPHAPIRRVLRRTGLLPKNIFSTVGEAIRAYVERAETELGEDVDWRRVDEPPRPSGGAA
jgi:MFS superfamily sulfate permease-like transporter